MHWGLAGCVGTQGQLGFRWHQVDHRGCRGHWVGKWTGSPTTLGPIPWSQHSHWFPLGSNLPGQGQASDRNELCRLLYTFGTIFSDSLHILYLCHLITYSYTQCKEMLYGLCSLQTNLHISLYHQSDDSDTVV